MKVRGLLRVSEVPDGKSCLLVARGGTLDLDHIPLNRSSKLITGVVLHNLEELTDLEMVFMTSLLSWKTDFLMKVRLQLNLLHTESKVRNCSSHQVATLREDSDKSHRRGDP